MELTCKGFSAKMGPRQESRKLNLSISSLLKPVTIFPFLSFFLSFFSSFFFFIHQRMGGGVCDEGAWASHWSKTKTVQSACFGLCFIEFHHSAPHSTPVAWNPAYTSELHWSNSLNCFSVKEPFSHASNALFGSNDVIKLTKKNRYYSSFFESLK